MTVTATAAPAPHGYVWAGWTAYPVEHVSDGTVATQPICDAPLHARQLRTAERPTGLAPLCRPCQRRAPRHFESTGGA